MYFKKILKVALPMVKMRQKHLNTSEHAMLQNWNHDKINVVNQFFLPGCIKCLNYKKSKLIYTDNNFN